MKKIILILALILAGSFAFSQAVILNETDLPSAVTATFKSLYPDSKVERWKAKNGNYMAETSADLNVLIDVNGKLIETEKVTATASLPALVSEYVIKNYPGIKIQKAYTVTSADGKISFKTEVGETCLFFDKEGKFIKSAMKDETESAKL